MRAARKGSPAGVDAATAFFRVAFPRLRPELRAYSEADRADKDVQLRTAKRRRLLAITIGDQAADRARKGLPPDKALTNCALSPDQLGPAFERRWGYRPARSTIQQDLHALFGGYHVGFLPARWDARRQIILHPGFTYDLRVLANTLGKHGRQVVQLVRNCLHRFTGSTLRPISDRQRTERRVQGAFDWAVAHAEGQRNSVGNLLAWLCRRIGLDRHDVEHLMIEYQQRVCWLGSHPYTQREAIATVRSAFKRA